MNPLKRLTIVLFVVVVVPLGCAGWTYNGLTADDIKRPTVASLSGFAATYIAHLASHIIAAEVMGFSWHMDGVSEIVDGEMSGSERTIFAMSGFAGQLAGGYAMRFAGLQNDFTRGYNSGTIFQIGTYPLLQPITADTEGDIRMADDGWIYWSGAAVLAGGLNWRIK